MSIPDRANDPKRKSPYDPVEIISWGVLQEIGRASHAKRLKEFEAQVAAVREKRKNERTRQI